MEVTNNFKQGHWRPRSSLLHEADWRSSIPICPHIGNTHCHELAMVKNRPQCTSPPVIAQRYIWQFDNFAHRLISVVLTEAVNQPHAALRCCQHVYPAANVCLWKSANAFSWTQVPTASTRCILAEATQFPAKYTFSSLELHSLISWSFDEFHQVISLVIIDCGYHCCGRHWPSRDPTVKPQTV